MSGDSDDACVIVDLDDDSDEVRLCVECGDDAMSGRDVCRHCARQQGEFD